MCRVACSSRPTPRWIHTLATVSVTAATVNVSPFRAFCSSLFSPSVFGGGQREFEFDVVRNVKSFPPLSLFVFLSPFSGGSFWSFGHRAFVI